MHVVFTEQAEIDLEEIGVRDVLIVRIIHGARDLRALFTDDT